MIKVEQLSKIYGSLDTQIIALNNVSFELLYGELTVILGPSGSGKSTLLNLLGGMDTASSGKIYLDGTEITSFDNKQLTKYRRYDIGFVFQFYNLMPHLTALENVQLAENTSTSIAKDCLQKVGLAKRMNNFPSQLSGGEQQRVAIARAIVKEPKVLLCDEPAGALDSNTGKSIINILRTLANNQNRAVVIVTHNANLAEIADRVIRLSDGNIIENIKQTTPKTIEEITW